MSHTLATLKNFIFNRNLKIPDIQHAAHDIKPAKWIWLYVEKYVSHQSSEPRFFVEWPRLATPERSECGEV